MDGKANVTVSFDALDIKEQEDKGISHTAVTSRSSLDKLLNHRMEVFIECLPFVRLWASF